MTLPRSQPKPWLRYDPPTGDVSLLCLPHAGGGASSFTRWLGLFPPGITPVRAQLPGREDAASRPPPHTVSEAVAALLSETARLTGTPVALYGHSMGALIGFELARALTAAGTPPVHLFVSGRRAPHRTASRAAIHHLPDEEFIHALDTMGGASGAATQSAAFRRYALRLIKADLRLCEEHTHRPGPPLTCPVTVFYGTEDPVVDLGEVEAWQSQTTGPFALRTFSGDHFFHQRHRVDIAAHMADALATALTGTAAKGEDKHAAPSITS
ncbi:thioesterase II family protein [Streptomyces sp. WMMC897]|uniref:thioesterase II family protein n=1 Tax=Streptomyces sp. WMMC897 TaxID=3014782 RepID=UPI0022B7015A|nr:alpha/beta fold hydrolase [Streptomyces sp. WMMC897]MCZ7412955.1 alpha/beta fold hydrolase [Streptomyces sp. WMMC897]